MSPLGLKNYQFSQILREYDERRLRARHELEERTREVNKRIPELARLDEQIAEQSVRRARLSLFGDASALNGLKEANQALSLQKKRLLIQNGYPEDYLMMRYQCPDCKDTGYIGTEKCHCFRQAIVDLVYAQSNVREAVKRENFQSFSFSYYSEDYVDELTGLTPLENIHRVVSTVRSFIRRFDSSYENLLLYGNTGVGKTFLSNCLAGELLNTAHTVIYLTAFQLFDILEQNKFGRSDEPERLRNQFEYILDCDLLIIDDLGTELANAFTTSQLYLCINERWLNRKSTVISTNLSLEQLDSTYGERIFSRIMSNYTLLKIFGEDIRLKKLLG